MKKIFVFLILIFSFGFAYAQTNLDSLYNVWEDESKTDSIRIKAYQEYIWFGHLFSNSDSTLIHAKRLNSFSIEKNSIIGQIMSIRFEAMTNSILGNFDKSNQLFNIAMSLAKKSKDSIQIATILGNLGYNENNQGNYSNALSLYKKSLKISEEINHSAGIGVAIANIGIIYDYQGDFVRAIEYYNKSVRIFKLNKNLYGESNSLANIGAIYSDNNQLEKALEYDKRSLKIRLKIKNKIGIADSYLAIGRNKHITNEFLESEKYLNKALNLFQEIGDKRGISSSYRQIGVLSNKNGKYDSAANSLLKGLGISEEIEDKEGMVDAYIILGDIYKKKKLFNKSLFYSKKGLSLAHEIGSIFYQKESSSNIYVAYKKLGNGNKALEYHEQMLVLNDSLKSEETAKKLQQMEFAKQVLTDSLVQVEKDLYIEMAHKEEVRKKDKNRNLALGAGIFFLVLSGGFFSRWRYVKKSKAIIEKEKDRSENLLLNILPFEIAEELKEKGSADAQDFEMVSILFSDFKGFTQASEKLSAKQLIGVINECFKAFDYICEKYGIEKIKTIGDAYMAAGGLPIPSDDSIKNTVLAALEMQSYITQRIIDKRAKNEVPFEMRLGIHTGPVVAGIVGVKKFQYDIWGNTVNTASRMESSGEVGKVNISYDTYELIKDDPQFVFESRGKIQAKGKGLLNMYFVTKAM
jgi:class 3 adenylate cyclase